MGRGSSISKLERLDQLLGTLKAGEAQTAKALAEQLGISLRTLMRDLETLRDKGYPIEADKGRGGGVRLYPRWGIGRLTLNYREVIDLLLGMHLLEKLQSPLFLTHLESVRNKLYATFPDVQKPQIRSLRKRILLGELATAQVVQSYSAPIHNAQNDLILESFFEQKCLQITYQREDGEIAARLIEIHFLFLSWPIWYLMAFDHLRNAPRVFRIDRVQRAEIVDQHFDTLDIDEFAPELAKFTRSL